MTSFVALGMRSEENASENCDNAPAHQPGLVKDISAKNNLTTLEYFPYSPDLVLAHFHQTPLLKSALSGQRFCSTTVVIKNVT